MGNREFAIELESRTKKFSVNIIRFAFSMPKSVEYNIIKNQLIKSATSIGANYREANRARSKADFIGRLKISQAEASETLYWLEILSEILQEKYKLDLLLNESNELLALFTAIINRLKQTNS